MHHHREWRTDEATEVNDCEEAADGGKPSEQSADRCDPPPADDEQSDPQIHEVIDASIARRSSTGATLRATHS